MEPSVKPCMPFGSGAGGGNVVRRRQVGGGTNQALGHSGIFAILQVNKSSQQQKTTRSSSTSRTSTTSTMQQVSTALEQIQVGFHFIALLLRERSKTWFSCRFRRADPRLPWHCPGAGAGLSPSQGEQKWQKRYKNLTAHLNLPPRIQSNARYNLKTMQPSMFNNL